MERLCYSLPNILHVIIEPNPRPVNIPIKYSARTSLSCILSHLYNRVWDTRVKAFSKKFLRGIFEEGRDDGGGAFLASPPIPLRLITATTNKLLFHFFINVLKIILNDFINRTLNLLCIFLI